jgi:hypothetical protein
MDKGRSETSPPSFLLQFQTTRLEQTCFACFLLIWYSVYALFPLSLLNVICLFYMYHGVYPSPLLTLSSCIVDPPAPAHVHISSGFCLYLAGISAARWRGHELVWASNI